MSIANTRHQDTAWRAQLELDFARRGMRTAIVKRNHFGPLQVQSAFYPEGDVPHVYLLHPPGGVVGGDQLQIDIRLGDGAHVLITTPASGKFYRSNGVLAQQQQTFCLKSGAVLEWLPQDTILFADSHVNMNTRVELAHDANFIGWEMLCFGRPASGETYSGGYCRQRIELWRDDEPVLIERARYDSNTELLSQAWGMQQKTVVATLLATAADTGVLAAARSIDLPTAQGILSCTLLKDVLVCRLLCYEAEVARKNFIHIWQKIRPLLLDREASMPRIWNT